MIPDVPKVIPARFLCTKFLEHRESAIKSDVVFIRDGSPLYGQLDDASSIVQMLVVSLDFAQLFEVNGADSSQQLSGIDGS